mmetsp:Transcript_14978/g.28622  ORF Transcript_14978/g.28622 Transcript_14978/m.28622 type:complete len:431 (+) Transcript_14978:330-1622(+)
MPLKKHKEYSAKQHDRQQTTRKADPDVKSEEIETWVGPNDVLTGRGAPQTDHEGNVRLRQLVIEFQPEYAATKRQQIKQSIATHIVDRIESRGGRFLRKVSCKMGEQAQQAVEDGETSGNIQQSSPISGGWVVVNDRKQIMEKVKQLFRDMGPESRKRRHTRCLYRYRKLGMKPGASSEDSKPSCNTDFSTSGYGTTAKGNSDAAKQWNQESVSPSEPAKNVAHDDHPSQTFPSSMIANTDIDRQLWNVQNAVKSQVPYPQIWSGPLYAHLMPPNSSFPSSSSNSLISTVPLQRLQQQRMLPHLSLSEIGFRRAPANSLVAQTWMRGPIPMVGSGTVGYPLPEPSTGALASSPYHAKLSSLPTERDVSTSTERNGSTPSSTASETPDLSSVGTNGAGRQPTLGDSVIAHSTETKPIKRQPKSSVPRSSNH